MTAQQQNMVDLLDKLGKASMEIQEQIRESHHATRDLRDATRDAKEYMGRLIQEELESHLTGLVKAEIDEMTKALVTVQREIEKKVEREISHYTDLMLGKPGTEGDLRAMLVQAGQITKQKIQKGEMKLNG